MRAFGSTEIKVSALGLGAGQIGDARISEAEIRNLLSAAVDLGVTVIDTAPSYGLSEERIGRHLKDRRHELILSTKVGYGVPGEPDWTFACISRGIDIALRKLQTDHIDTVHLHSCGVEVLRDGAVMDALDEARHAGKIRVAAYSGENEALTFALATQRFQSIECSINLCDQKSIADVLPLAAHRQIGVIAKRPVPNAPWRFKERPVGDYAEEYWHRWKTMNIDPGALDWQELALRFVAFTPGVSTCIVGTANIDHLRRNVSIVAKGALPADQVAAIRSGFRLHGEAWLPQL